MNKIINERKKKVKLLSHLRLSATPWTVAYQGPLSMGVSRQEYWSGVPFPSPRDLPNPGIEPMPSAVGTWSLITGHQESEIAQLCPTLCDPMDCSLPGSSVHGIFQAVVLEWIAISFSRGSSQPRDRTQVSRIAGRCFTI